MTQSYFIPAQVDLQSSVHGAALVWTVVPVHWSGGLVVQAYNRSGSWGRHRVVHINCLFWYPQIHTTDTL